MFLKQNILSIHYICCAIFYIIKIIPQKRKFKVSWGLWFSAYITFNRRYGDNYKAARVALKELIRLYYDCPYTLFHEVADTLSYHFDSICNSFIMIQRTNADGLHLSRLSNGPMESLNRIAKDLKRNGHGYRNFEHLRNRFLFSQRKNASILAVPKTFEDACPKTDISRGPYKKKE